MSKKIIIVLLTIILLVACSPANRGTTPRPLEIQETPEVLDAAYPYPEITVENEVVEDPVEIKTPYPDSNTLNDSALSTSDAQNITVTVPAPDNNTGVITGRLFSTKMGAPLSKMGVYLGEYIYLTPGPDYMVSLRQESSPHTITDAGGNFLIVDVQPGEYPIIAWTPINSYVIPGESGEKELVIVVVAGQVTDLGEIRIDWP